MTQNSNEENIFFEEHNTDVNNHLFDKPNEFPESIPYLKRGDSSMYIDQFLVSQEEKNKQESQEQINPQTPQKSQSPSISVQLQNQHSSDESGRFRASSFHNFQKHLTISLKFSIEITNQDKSVRDYQKAAAKMWKIFKNSSISTKKILHFLLGEKNEHRITEEGIRQYGLHSIYQAYNEKTLKEARNYLARETLRQIQQGKLNEYIESKKMKNKQQFTKYVDIFVEELKQGFLRKRLSRERVAELTR